MAGLPPEIKAMAELSPVEDLLLAILREGLPGVQVKSLIAKGQTFPLVLVRRSPSFAMEGGDTRFVDTAQISVQCFCADPNGDEDAAILSEACRVVLRDAWLGNKVVPGRGHLTRVTTASPPRRVTDWATAAGPVQYADLPTGVWRYESLYDISIRKPRVRPYPNTTP
ncbi:tail terminator [Streptomyces phage Yosif]|uniref:Tail terminator n=1 Tax=Streptomyces phage Yosif TaxID=2201421 RepID=A0A2Z4QBR7_9CAUD|nr:tail terminator [Streptomyces phage Yosif]AWY07579.1 tail terminator [Streptomyces phage Yosif]